MATKKVTKKLNSGQKNRLAKDLNILDKMPLGGSVFIGKKWEELSKSQKIGRLRKIIALLVVDMDNMRNTINELYTHSHSGRGDDIVVPVKYNNLFNSGLLKAEVKQGLL